MQIRFFETNVIRKFGRVDSVIERNNERNNKDLITSYFGSRIRCSCRKDTKLRDEDVHAAQEVTQAVASDPSPVDLAPADQNSIVASKPQ